MHKKHILALWGEASLLSLLDRVPPAEICCRGPAPFFIAEEEAVDKGEDSPVPGRSVRACVCVS